jgi:hypothetical protein
MVECVGKIWAELEVNREPRWLYMFPHLPVTRYDNCLSVNGEHFETIDKVELTAVSIYSLFFWRKRNSGRNAILGIEPRLPEWPAKFLLRAAMHHALHPRYSLAFVVGYIGKIRAGNQREGSENWQSQYVSAPPTGSFPSESETRKEQVQGWTSWTNSYIKKTRL